MVDGPDAHNDSIVVLYKGGRLPAWDGLSPEEQRSYEQIHVDLMLSVAREHRLIRLEGFRLMTPQQTWVRFWVIEFLTLEGAETWIEAEMAPPYGSYGYYEYYVARPWMPDYFSTWVTHPAAAIAPADRADPRNVPALDVDCDSVVVLLFGRWLPGAEDIAAEERGDAEHIELMQAVAREHGLMRLEAFKLIGPQAAWHRVWVIEFPTLEGAEAWVEAEVQLPHGRYATKTVHLARKWAPDYFARWVPQQENGS